MVLTLSLIDQGGSETPNFQTPRAKSMGLTMRLIDQGGAETLEFAEASSEIRVFDLEPD